MSVNKTQIDDNRKAFIFSSSLACLFVLSFVAPPVCHRINCFCRGAESLHSILHDSFFISYTP